MTTGIDLWGNPTSPPEAAKQPLLFDLEFYLNSIGLTQIEAKTMHATGLLSFDPGTSHTLTENHVMELDFVCALHKSGCPAPFLKRLLSDLPKPYAYPVSEMHLDWRTLTWTRLISPKETVERWVDQQVEEADGDGLLRLANMVHKALEKLGLSYKQDPDP